MKGRVTNGSFFKTVYFNKKVKKNSLKCVYKHEISFDYELKHLFFDIVPHCTC